MRRLLVLGAAVGVLSACRAIRSALRAVDGALEGVGRVPLKKVDGLFRRLDPDAPAPADLFGRRSGFFDLPIVENRRIPEGKILFAAGTPDDFDADFPTLLASPVTLHGGLVPWEGG